MAQFVYERKMQFTPPQKKIWYHPARFKVLKCGRRFGKTMMGLNWLIEMAIKSPKQEVCYSAKTHRQAEDVAFDELLKMVPEEMVKKINRRTLHMILVNGCRITVTGSERADNLRGRKLAALFMDEAAFQDAGAWSNVFRPMLLDSIAPALLASSPRRGWFSTIYDYAKSGQNKDYAAFHYTIYDSVHDRNEIAAIKATTPDHVWRSEYMAEELDTQGVIYGEFNPMVNVVRVKESFPNFMSWPCFVGCDPGLFDPTGVAWVHVSPDGNCAVVSTEHVRAGWTMDRHSEVIVLKSRGKNIDRSDYVLDRTAFRREATSGVSIADQLRDNIGVNFQKSEKDLNGSLDIVKSLMRGNGTKPALYIDESCEETRRGFQHWEYGQHEPDAIAAVRYALIRAVRKGVLKQPASVLASHSKQPAFEVPDYVGHLPIKKKGVGRLSWGYGSGFDYEFGVPS